MQRCLEKALGSIAWNHFSPVERDGLKERLGQCSSSTSRWWLGVGHCCRQLPLQHGWFRPAKNYPWQFMLYNRCWMGLVTHLGSLWNHWRLTSRELGKAKSHWWEPWFTKSASPHYHVQVGSILAGFIMLVGPISSVMVNKFGPRLTCIGKQEIEIKSDKQTNKKTTK